MFDPLGGASAAPFEMVARGFFDGIAPHLAVARGIL